MSLRVLIAAVVMMGIVTAARTVHACPAARLDGGRRAAAALDEYVSFRETYARDRQTAFAAIRRASRVEGEEPPTLDAPLHVGATYVVSASAFDLCQGDELVTSGSAIHGPVVAAETERWGVDVAVGQRYVFEQTALPTAERPNLSYQGLLFAGTVRHRDWVEVSAGVLTPERLEASPRTSFAPPAPRAATRAFLVSAIPGTRMTHALVLTDAPRPLATTYLDVQDFRRWSAPIAVSGRVGYLDPTRQGFAGVGAAVVFPALRLGIDGSAETNPVRARHLRASATLGGTHVFSRQGAYVSAGIKTSASRYTGRSIRPFAASASGFDVGLFAGGGLPWVAMGFDAKVGAASPERLAVMPAAYGNGEGSIRAVVRVTPYVRKLPPSFRTISLPEATP